MLFSVIPLLACSLAWQLKRDVLFLFTGLTGIGILIIIAISAIELKALFKAQLIVQDYNNGIMEAIYRDISQQQVYSS